MQIGALIILSISWSSILGVQVMMIPMKMEKKYTTSLVFGAIVNVVFNIFLINNLLSVGSTIATVAAEFRVTIVQVYYLRRIIDIKIIDKNAVKPIILSIMMCFVIIIIKSNLPISILSTLFQSLIGVIVYIVFMYMFKDMFLMSCLKEAKKKIYNNLIKWNI